MHINSNIKHVRRKNGGEGCSERTQREGISYEKQIIDYLES
jgi:hypothetical protein